MTDPLEPVDALSTLGDATRRGAYDYVCAQGRPVGRDEVAGALGIGRTLAAYHLDRLAEAGLLAVAYARRSGRTGPGAGRPAKLYERSDREIAAAATDPPDLDRLLRERGYEPYMDDAGVTRLRNCPFHAVAQSHPEVVCDMNLSLLAATLAGLDADLHAVLEPGPGRCCVAIKAGSR